MNSSEKVKLYGLCMNLARYRPRPSRMSRPTRSRRVGCADVKRRRTGSTNISKPTQNSHSTPSRPDRARELAIDTSNSPPAPISANAGSQPHKCVEETDRLSVVDGRVVVFMDSYSIPVPNPHEAEQTLTPIKICAFSTQASWVR